MAVDHERLWERFSAAMQRADFGALAELLTPDWVEEYPQSGEVIRGLEKLRGIFEHRPGGPAQGTLVGLQGGQEEWLLTPTFTLVRVEGSGSTGAALVRLRYPDGARWWRVIQYELEAERIARMSSFFAPEFEAPEWRAPYVERMQEGDRQAGMGSRDREPMMSVDHRALWERYTQAINRRDPSLLEEVLAADLIDEWPQSGERIRGRDNLYAVLERYPGGLPEEPVDLGSARVAAGTEEQWVMTPVFTLTRVEASGTRGTAMFRSRYPDGSWWWVVLLYEVEGDKIARSTTFFAPEFEAPEWRAPFVERRAGRGSA